MLRFVSSFLCLSPEHAPPNGVRYAPHAFCGVLVGGMRKRHFDGTNFKPRKLLENAPTPTRRVQALLAAFDIE